jgi:hypothetical protein
MILVIEEKPLIYMGLMQHLASVEFGERKRTHLLYEDATTVKGSFYR